MKRVFRVRWAYATVLLLLVCCQVPSVHAQDDAPETPTYSLTGSQYCQALLSTIRHHGSEAFEASDVMRQHRQLVLKLSNTGVSLNAVSGSSDSAVTKYWNRTAIGKRIEGVEAHYQQSYTDERERQLKERHGETYEAKPSDMIAVGKVFEGQEVAQFLDAVWGHAQQLEALSRAHPRVRNALDVPIEIAKPVGSLGCAGVLTGAFVILCEIAKGATASDVHEMGQLTTLAALGFALVAPIGIAAADPVFETTRAVFLPFHTDLTSPRNHETLRTSALQPGQWQFMSANYRMLKSTALALLSPGNQQRALEASQHEFLYRTASLTERMKSRTSEPYTNVLVDFLLDTETEADGTTVPRLTVFMRLSDKPTAPQHVFEESRETNRLQTMQLAPAIVPNR